MRTPAAQRKLFGRLALRYPRAIRVLRYCSSIRRISRRFSIVSWAAPRFLVHTKWEFPQRLSACSTSELDGFFMGRLRSHSSLNSRGVL
jgi:hypothetical protein